FLALCAGNYFQFVPLSFVLALLWPGTQRHELPDIKMVQTYIKPILYLCGRKYEPGYSNFVKTKKMPLEVTGSHWTLLELPSSDIKSSLEGVQ
ncbi:26341_t:CDS:2, partial [Racocetra persica]